MYYYDKHMWPVEVPKGRPILKWIRRLIHTRKITFRPPFTPKHRVGGDEKGTT